LISPRTRRAQPGRALSCLIGTALSLAIAAVLIATPLRLLVTPGYVERQYHRAGFPPSDRFSAQERVRLSEPVLLYLRGRAPAGALSELRTDDGAPAFRADEVQHLVDVRGVIRPFMTAQVVALALTVAALTLLAARRQWRVARLALRVGALGILGILAVVLGSSLINFDAFFTRFHQVFFQPGSWLFYEEDTLIQLYPLPLWIRVVRDLVLAIAAELAVVLGASFLLPGRTGGRSA
jgi:integral membrane protein (TIGR01906 family)